ncbi:apolipoprotein B-100 [Danio rerio]|uniref:Apolipoprotein B-100 n=1 Tax=Danio rerio TaxID=7955 RepID=A0A8M1RMK1_DANRE|nr:apolipoprotein B-100 [Danio rerio]|eukprot:XP_002665852.3 apolipoprotein B-100 [Danio rerio]
MGDHKLRLLLFFSLIILSICRRFKPLSKHEYFYETESLNSLNKQVNGPKASCRVEILVPDASKYILRTTDCKLSEVTAVDTEGNPVFGKAAAAEDFRTDMEKNPLKFTVTKGEIRLFPEKGERANILNIKRGIISALAVPLLEEDRKKNTPSIYGLCMTEYTVDTATAVTLNRDLSRCDKFRPIEDHTSPLALITGLSHPLAQLIRSNQTCNYKFDKEQEHMTSAICTEKHVLVPFSHKGEYGVTNTGKQVLTLLGVTENNDRVFDHNIANMKPLHLDRSVDISPVQDKEAALAVLRELADLYKTNSGRKRAHLAYKLVAVIRKMEAETLRAALPEALGISRSLTYQALLQCGTPKCSSAIMQIIRTFDKSSFEVDAAVYAIGIIPQTSQVLVKEMLATAKIKPSRPIYYALSNAVRRLYETDGVTSEIQAVADYALEQIGDCTGDQEHVFLSLKVIGNMVAALGAARPALHSAVIKCINQPGASPAVQQAAIQVYRQFPVPEEGREVLMHTVLDKVASVQKRVAAYLILMKNPTPAELAQLAAALEIEKNHEAKSFIISHISSIMASTAPETLNLRQNIQNAFQGNDIEMAMKSTQFSRHYRLGSLEGNFIFESPDNLPREVMLEMTLNAFGLDMDLIEIGMEGKGFEPILEALFGEDGFFPDIVMKSILYATDKMPAELNEVWDNMLPNLNNYRKKRQATQNIVKEISDSVNKLSEDLKAQDAPEAMVYLKLLGAELGYLDAKDGKMIGSLLKMIPTDFTKRLFSSVDNELFLHYIFMDNEFYLPTAAGFPLRVALSGTFTPGIKGGLSFNPGMGDFAFMLSAGVELVTEIGTHLPDYVHSGLEMHTNIYHESGLRAKISGTQKRLKLSIPAPREPTELISVTNSLVSVVGGKILPISANVQYTMEDCTAVFPGLKSCTTLEYPDAALNDNAPYFPLTGDSRFAVEIRPSGTVTEYTAIIGYTYEDEEDKLTFSVKAEGTPFEVLNTVMINRKLNTASMKLLMEALQLDHTVSGKFTNAEKLKLELQSDLKLPGTTSVQTLILTYESEKIEAEVKSHFNSKTRTLVPLFRTGDTIIIGLLTRQMGQNKIKLLDIIAKLAAFSGVPATLDITLPEELFLNIDAAVKYHFGQPYYTITLPLPLGGKSTRDLKFPTTLSTDLFIVDPDLESMQLPEVSIPESVTLSLHAFQLADVSGKLRCHLYDLDATVSAARDPAAHSSYSAKLKVTGTSPVEQFCLQVEGSALAEATSGDSLKASMKTVIEHKFFNATISVEEEVQSAAKLSVKSKSKLEVTSLVAEQMSVEHNAIFEGDAGQISGDGNLEGSFKAGSIYGSGNLKQSVLLIPSKQEAKIDSLLKVDSKLLQAQNSFSVAFANRELTVLSTTTAFDDILTNTAKVAINESQIGLSYYTKAQGFGLKIENTAETRADAKAISVKIETSGDLSQERIYSIVTGELDINGLAIKSDASAKLMGHRAAHNAILNFNKDGLTSSGTTTLQSILSQEKVKNTFEVIYKKLTANLQCKTNGKFIGASIDHNTEMKINGLLGRIENILRFNSRILNVETNTRGTTVPFSFNFNFAANGSENVYNRGHYREDFNTKMHLKIDPESITHSHECKISTLVETYGFYGVEVESEFQSKSELLLNPSEQKAKMAVKVKVNKHAINQEINAYNTPAQFGLEGSGKVFTNLLNTADDDHQDFAVSAFLKYDKNNQMHSIYLPFVDSLGLVPSSVILTYSSIEETLAYLAYLSLPKHVSNFVSNMNFGRRAEQFQRASIALYQEYPLKLGVYEKQLSDMISQITEALSNFKQLTANGMLIENVDRMLTKHINALMFLITEDVKLLLSLLKPQGHTKLQIPASTKSYQLPCFEKMHGEIRFTSPVYSLNTSAEFKNVSATHPQFAGVIKSKGISASLEVLNYNIDYTMQISIPEMTPVSVSETLKITHSYLTLDQSASLTLNASITKGPDFSSLSLDTSYKNQVNIPLHSLSSEVTLASKAVAVYQNNAAVILKVLNTGIGKFTLEDFSDEGTHDSDLLFTMGLSAAKLRLKGHTDSSALQMEMNVDVDADAVALSYLKFNVFAETKSPFIKKNLLVASGNVSINDMDVKISGNHETEFDGVVSVVLSNTASVIICPREIAVEFQNKGNAKTDLYEFLITSVDLQNDYTVIVNSDLQEVSTIAVAQINHYKYSHNLTANNNNAEIGVYAGVNSFGILNNAVQFVPFVFKKAVVEYLKDESGIWHDFTTNNQATDLNAKLVYQKTTTVLGDSDGLAVVVPSLGNLVSEVSSTSSILNLNANAGVYPDDYLMRISGTATSAFQQLRAKLYGATIITTESGLKLASTLFLDNSQIGGTHNSSVTLQDNYEVVLVSDTIAKINLTIFSIEADHQLSADTKTHLKALSNLKIKYSFDHPDSRGGGDAENTLKMNAYLSSITVESTSQVTTNSTLPDGGALKGTLDSDANISVNVAGLKSNVKASANGYYDYRNNKLSFDMNDQVILEGNFNRIHYLLDIDSNYTHKYRREEVAVKHTAHGKTTIIPMSTFMAAVDFFLTQPDHDDFEHRGEGFGYINKTSLYNGQIYSRWFNSSTAISVESDNDSPDRKFLLECSFNFTAPSVLVEYESELRSIPIKIIDDYY